MSPRLIPCVGCHALVPDIDGPTHRYLGASPGCWRILGEDGARQYTDSRYFSVNRLWTDAYAVQHPGTPSPQTIQSVAEHLISLCAIFERAYTFEMATEAMRHVHERRGAFVWLEPPVSLGAITIVDVAQAPDAATYIKLAHQWAREAWDAWQPHHPTIRRWAEL